jgi:hypothetical protein
MNEPDPLLRALDRVAAEQLRPGLAQRVLVRHRRPGASWALPALVAAAACSVATVLFWTSLPQADTSAANLAQWGEMADTAKDLAP